MNIIPEKDLHKQICIYIKAQYSSVIFNTDLSGIKLTIGQAKKAKRLRSSKSFPDITIYETNNIYHGLFLEVKKVSPFKKDGTLFKSEHLENQAEMIRKLNKRGYLAQFVWTFDKAKYIIDNYLKLL